MKKIIKIFAPTLLLATLLASCASTSGVEKQEPKTKTEKTAKTEKKSNKKAKFDQEAYDLSLIHI